MSIQCLGKKCSGFVAVFLLALAGMFGAVPAATAQTQVAVEYYYADWDFYFVTSNPDEITALDGGAFGGVWKRTGQTFNVWSGPTNGALPACRFFSVIFAPRSSHFYTPYSDECASLKAGNAWQYEGVAFYVLLPDANGNCPQGTTVLFRLYNNGMGGAPNHRFTIDLATFNQMRALGWTFEGDGRTGAYACVPTSSGPLATAEGLWLGNTSDGAYVIGFVLDDATFYFIYSSQTDAGIITGSASEANGQFSSTDAVDVDLLHGIKPATISGSFVPQGALTGSLAAFGNLTFALLYDQVYEQPASLATAAGNYAGGVGTLKGNGNATVVLGANGTLAGTALGCSISGTLTPRGNVNIFDLTVTYQGGACVIGTDTVTGVAYYDAATATLFGVGSNAGRTNGFLAILTKQ
jgi:hypothetical protein